MKRSGEKLGGRKQDAILALLTARSIEEAARTGKVPLRTLYRWLKEPAFSSEYRRARRDGFGQALARLQQGSSAAATTMLKIMIDTNLPASTRLRASEYVFTHAKNGIEMEDLEARIAAPEDAAEASKQL